MSKKYSSSTIHQSAISELRSFFGFMSNSDIISLATGIQAEVGGSATSQAQAGLVGNLGGQGNTVVQSGYADEAQAVMNLLLDVTEGAYYTYNFTTETEIKQQLTVIPQGGRDEGSYSAGVQQFVQMIHEGPDTTDALYVVASHWSSGTAGSTWGTVSQGINRIVAPAKEVSAGTFELCSEEEVGINKSAFAKPDKIYSPSLSAYLFNSLRIGPQTRDTDAVGIFANSIPNVELSRCVPYINMTFYTDLPGKNVQADKNGQMGILRFLGAVDHGPTATDLDRTGLANVTPDVVFQQVDGDDLASDILSSAGMDTSDQVRVGFAGMEMFTTPMTLANADMNASGYVASHYGNKEILDPLRPLLTLTSLTVRIDGTGHAALASKKASVTMKLHDRSRMSDIAPMISADRFGNTHVIVEYGWKHPDGGFNSSNAYGKFLDSLRLKDAFNITYTEMSINNTGEVDITMELANLGTHAAITAPIVAGRFIPLSIAKSLINRYITGLMNINVSAPGNSMLTEIRNKFEVGVGDGSGTADIVRRSIVAEIVQNVKTGNISELNQIIERLVGENGEGGELAESTESAKLEIDNKLLSLRYGVGGDIDVFRHEYMFSSLARFTYGGGGFVSHGSSAPVDPQLYTSLGRVVCSFIGYPIASCLAFDEVQVLFYAFNSQAGAMRPYSTSHFPIRIADLIDLIDRIAYGSDGGQLGRIPTAADMMSLLTDIVSNPMHFAYGMSDLYEAYSESEQDSEAVARMSEAEREVYNENRQAEEELLSSRQSRKLNLIYAADGLGGTGDFKLPQLQFYLEPVPALTQDEDGSTVVVEGSTILRIHVFDKSASPHTAELFMLKMANDTEVAGRYNQMAATEESIAAELAASEEELVRVAGDSGISSAVFHSMVAQHNDLSDVLEESQAVVNNEFTSYINSIPSWAIKEKIKTTVPSMTMGSMFNAIKNASVSSTTNGAVQRERLITANLDRQDNQQLQGAGNSVDDIFVIPATLDVKMFGMPLLNYGQQFFIDLGTGTTLDNMYAATGIRHTLNSSGFETSFKCTFLGSGTTRNLRNTIIGAQPILVETEEESEQ